MKKSIKLLGSLTIALPLLAGCNLLPNGNGSKNSTLSSKQKDITSIDETKTIGDYVVKSYYDKSLVITEYKGKAKELTIPSELDGQKVSLMKAGMFKKGNSIDKLVVPGEVGMEYGCLANLSSLDYLTLGSLSTNVGALFGDQEFSNSYKVTQRKNVDGRTQGVIGYIPNSLKEITLDGGYAPAYCCMNMTSLTKVTINNIADGISVGTSSFAECSNLKEVEITGDKSYDIGFESFNECTKLSKITFAPNLDTILGSAFYHCNFDELVIDNTADETKEVKIEKLAFCYATINKLTLGKVRFQKDGTYGYAPFRHTTIKSLHLTEKTKSLEIGIFERPDLLSEIVVNENNPYFHSDNNCNAIITKEGGKFVKDMLLVGCNKAVIPDGVTSIASGAFKGCTLGSSFNIPSSVVSIGSYAFYETYLSNADFSNIRIFGVASLYTCSMRRLTIDSLPNNSFAYIFSENGDPSNIPSSLAIVTLTMEEVPANAFRDCGQFTTVILAPTVKSIGDNAFQNCSNLRNIYWTTSLRKLGNETFRSTIIRNIYTTSNDTLLKTFGETAISDAYLLSNLMNFTTNVTYGFDYNDLP